MIEKIRLPDGKHYYSNKTGVLYSDSECQHPVKKRKKDGSYEDLTIVNNDSYFKPNTENINGDVNDSENNEIHEKKFSFIFGKNKNQTISE